MRIVIKTDFSGLDKFVETMPGKIDQALYEIANNVGSKMAREAIGLIAGKIGVTPDIVEAAVVRRAATVLDPSYDLSARDEKFPMVRWVTQRDEKVCKICGPRDGHLYSTMEIRYIFPAHPNCRCQLDQVLVSEELDAVADQILPETLDDAARKVLDVFTLGLNG